MRHGWCAAVVLLAALSRGTVAAQPSEGPDTLQVSSGGLTLHALVWRPAETGPFPAVFFNHGSWPAGDSSAGRILAQAESLGPVFARHGYVFFYLFRRGVGLSEKQGVHVGDLMVRANARGGPAASNQVLLAQLDGDEMDDATAGLATLRALRGVRRDRIGLVGHSFGGTLSLLQAERDGSVAAVVDFAGAAASWNGSPELRGELLRAMATIRSPVLIVHAENDYSVDPGKALAAELLRLGKPYRLIVYPAFGTRALQGHNIVHQSVALWESDVFAFLDRYLKP